MLNISIIIQTFLFWSLVFEISKIIKMLTINIIKQTHHFCIYIVIEISKIAITTPPSLFAFVLFNFDFYQYF